MKVRLATLTACLLLLTACGGSGSLLVSGMEDLLQAPTLNQRQAEVYDALSATLHIPDIVYKYPQNGEFRSPFVFCDMDGDGVEEAVVFYAYAVNPGEVRAKVMRQDAGGQWYSFYDISGQGDQIDFVQFSHLLDNDTPCLLIGWVETGKRESLLGVYTLRDEVFRREVWQAYTAYTVMDRPGLELSQLVLVTQDGRGGPYELLLYGPRDQYLVEVDALYLDRDVTNVLQMLRGRLYDGDGAVFIDEVLDNDTIATEIVRVDQTLRLEAGGSEGQDSWEWIYYVETFRPDRVLCTDLNEDGQIEIPQFTYLPGTEESDEITPLMLTEYRHLTQNGLQIVYRAVVNEGAGYLVYYPDRWLDQVTVVSYPETGEWRFYRIGSDDYYPTVELLRIVVFSSRDSLWQGGDGYFHLETKSGFQYYGYVPQIEGEPLAVSEAEARSLFALLS